MSFTFKSSTTASNAGTTLTFNFTSNPGDLLVIACISAQGVALSSVSSTGWTYSQYSSGSNLTPPLFLQKVSTGDTTITVTFNGNNNQGILAVYSSASGLTPIAAQSPYQNSTLQYNGTAPAAVRWAAGNGASAPVYATFTTVPALNTTYVYAHCQSYTDSTSNSTNGFPALLLTYFACDPNTSAVAFGSPSVPANFNPLNTTTVLGTLNGTSTLGAIQFIGQIATYPLVVGASSGVITSWLL
jgi:hypothetical protein